MSNLNSSREKSKRNTPLSSTSATSQHSHSKTTPSSTSTATVSDDNALVEVNANQSLSFNVSQVLEDDKTPRRSPRNKSTRDDEEPVVHTIPSDSVLDVGSTSSKKRSKRPKPAIASEELLKAKMAQKQKMRETGGNFSPKFEEHIIIKDHLKPAKDVKDTILKPTGIIYDMRMTDHKCLWDDNYPEKPERFTYVINRCKELGLLDRCISISPRFAEESEILSCHTKEHIDRLKNVCELGKINNIDGMEEEASNFDAVYFHPTTYDLSLLSAGCTIDLVNSILDNKIQNGMAIVRPPGHHAMKSEYCGYCYFNNVAISAKLALENGKADKILIVDFDVHHGQATQQMFYNDPRVLYFSTHRYEKGTFWPNLEESDYNWIGKLGGLGFNCNIPLNKTGLGNSDFLAVWHQILLPMAYQFNPDLVIISAGYDAALGCFEFNPDLVIVSAGYDSAFGDEKGEMEISPQFYPHLVHPLLGLAQGKVAVVLEGGYCLKSLAEGAALTLRTLLQDPCPAYNTLLEPSESIVETIYNSTYMLKYFWSLLLQIRLKDVDINNDDEITDDLHIPSIFYEWREPKQDKYLTRDCYPVQDQNVTKSLDARLDQLILTTSLKKALNRVGLVYDDRMLEHRNALEPGHPERPDRIANIFACHADFGLIERCLRIEPRIATNDELLLIHTQEHIDKMKLTQCQSQRELNKLKEFYNSIFFNNKTYESALLAAGSLLQTVDSVLNGDCQAGVAIVRPPGHHAEADYPCGFCIFNNVSLAAQYAISIHGLKRVLVVDWDVHHGNGIQRMFLNDPRVLYISLHRYDNGGFFPGSTDADYSVVGDGKGEGFTINIPWNGGGMGDSEYLMAFTNIILPVAYEYNPELVLVSAGFDAANGDPLGGFKVSPEGYGHMTRLLSSLANGKIILALEGGYNLRSIAYSMTLCTKALLGDPIPQLTLKDQIKPSAYSTIHSVLSVHRAYWTSIRPYGKFVPSDPYLINVGDYTLYEEEKKARDQNLNDSTISETELQIQMMENLRIREDTNRSRSSGESPINNPQTKDPRDMIPDPPISSGEPSAAIPNLEQFGRPAGRTNPVVEEGNNTFGGGESRNMEAQQQEQEAEVDLEEELEGAVGGASVNSSISNANATVGDLSTFNLSISFAHEDDMGGFIVAPLKYCPHLEQINPVPSGGIDTSRPCFDCGSRDENWICLTCYSVYCSRYVREHMQIHNIETGHKIALSFSDLSVWCYADNAYLDCDILNSAKQAASLHKFGVGLENSSFSETRL